MIDDVTTQSAAHARHTGAHSTGWLGMLEGRMYGVAFMQIAGDGGPRIPASPSSTSSTTSSTSATSKSTSQSTSSSSSATEQAKTGAAHTTSHPATPSAPSVSLASSHSTSNTSTTTKSKSTADTKHLQRDQQTLEQRERSLRDEHAPSSNFAHAPNQALRQEERDINARKQRDADEKVKELRTDYYSSHDTHVDEHGRLFDATYDDVSGNATFTRTETVSNPSPARHDPDAPHPPTTLTISEQYVVDLRANTTSTTTASGALTRGGRESTTVVRRTDAAGAQIDAHVTHERRDVAADGATTELRDEQHFDSANLPTYAHEVQSLRSADHASSSSSDVVRLFTAGVLTSIHGVTTSLERWHDAAVDSGGVDERHPAIDREIRTRTETRIDNAGEPILDAAGTLQVAPRMTFDSSDVARYRNQGQDDDTDFVVSTTRHASTDASGALTFDGMQHTTETSEGKDGAKVTTFDTPIDAVSGAVVDTPPVSFQVEPTRYDTDSGPYDVPASEQKRREAWLRQNAHGDDQRSGWRKFKDGATKTLGVAGAVGGAALLFTGVGTGVGAALLGVSLASFASTGFDYATGRNHVSGGDLALSAAQMIPGGVATSMRLGAGLASGAKTAGRLSSVASALDTTSIALGRSYAGFETLRTGERVLTGEHVTGMDALNLLAAWGGARDTFRAHGVDGSTAAASLPTLERYSTPRSADQSPLHPSLLGDARGRSLSDAELWGSQGNFDRHVDKHVGNYAADRYAALGAEPPTTRSGETIVDAASYNERARDYREMAITGVLDDGVVMYPRANGGKLLANSTSLEIAFINADGTIGSLFPNITVKRRADGSLKASGNQRTMFENFIRKELASDDLVYAARQAFDRGDLAGLQSTLDALAGANQFRHRSVAPEFSSVLS